MNKKFKYSAKFSLSSFAKEIVESKKKELIAKASVLDDIPDHIDLQSNPDLIGLRYDAAVVNAFNRNGQGISTDTAIAIYKKFISKPTNIEHEQERIVGHIVNAFFTKHKGDEKLSEEEVVKMGAEKFDISLSSLLYTMVDSLFTEIALRSANPEDQLYEVMSASWEVLFSEYHVAVGSKNLSECTIYTEKEDIEKFSKFLLSKGGTGYDNEGNIVNQLIVGEAVPVGIGFTTQPAADVKGLESTFWEEEEEYEQKAAAKQDNISQNENSDVKPNKVLTNLNKNMNEDLMKKLETFLASQSKKEGVEEAKASFKELVNEAIEAGNNDYKQKLEDEVTAKKKAEATAKELEEKIDKLEADAKAKDEKLKALEDAEAERLAVATLNSRIEEIDGEYELDDATRAVIMGKLKDLDDEAFASYKEELKVLMSEKLKSNIALAKKEAEEAEAMKKKEEAEKATASTKSDEDKKEEEEKQEKNIEDALDTAKASDATVSTPSTEKNLAEQFEDAFLEGDFDVQI